MGSLGAALGPSSQPYCWGSIISLGATTTLAQEEGWQMVHFSDVDLVHHLGWWHLPHQA